MRTELDRNLTSDIFIKIENILSSLDPGYGPEVIAALWQHVVIFEWQADKKGRREDIEKIKQAAVSLLTEWGMIHK